MFVADRWTHKARRLVRNNLRAFNPSLLAALVLAGCGGGGGNAAAGIVSVTPSGGATPAPSPSPTPTPVPTPSPTPTPSTTQPSSVTPIASNFDRAPLIVTGYDHGIPGNLPPSMAPDVVGAFRFICTAGQMNYDDPILYPGVKGGSPHLHQWYGNTAGNYASTYATLRASGDSTCSNMLNRSAYWVPALMNAAGKVIQPDYLSIYYKRLPDGDPMCLKESAKGCTGIPTGLRVVSGYDMKRMGEAQPENITFTHRCISPGKPSIHRQTLADAISDCG
ncbi:DUF1996 domain-containing protein, partial [uncultured Sphingomonas sp.]